MSEASLSDRVPVAAVRAATEKIKQILLNGEYTNEEFVRETSHILGIITALGKQHSTSLDKVATRITVALLGKEEAALCDSSPKNVVWVLLCIAKCGHIELDAIGRLAKDSSAGLFTAPPRQYTLAQIGAKLEDLDAHVLELSRLVKDFSIGCASARPASAPRGEVQCHWCLEPGHIAPNCPKKKQGKPRVAAPSL